MTVTLRAIREEDYPGWLEASKAGYADDMIQNGRLPQETAYAKAEADFARLLPDGLATPGATIAVVEEDGVDVGHVWLAEHDALGGRALLVFDVEIDEPHRGRGLGKAAMRLAEDEARTRGLTRIELNVFGGNEVARSLYRSLGYEEMAVHMGKDIA